MSDARHAPLHKGNKKRLKPVLETNNVLIRGTTQFCMRKPQASLRTPTSPTPVTLRWRETPTRLAAFGFQLGSQWPLDCALPARTVRRVSEGRAHPTVLRHRLYGADCTTKRRVCQEHGSHVSQRIMPALRKRRISRIFIHQFF